MGLRPIPAATSPCDCIGGRASVQYFDITGAKVVLGRKFLPGEDEAGKDDVVLLSNALWRSRFGADPGVIGRQITLDGEPHEIVGVLESAARSTARRGRSGSRSRFSPANMTRDFHWFGAIGKLKAGVTLEQARAEMDVIGKRIAEDYPDSNQGWSVSVNPLAEQMIGPQIRTAVIALFSATAFVLLIGCANLANLALARGVARRREVAVRASLGAGKWRLARQFLTENLLCPSSAACSASASATRRSRHQRGDPAGHVAAGSRRQHGLDVLLFALGVTVLTGILFGLAPAIQATRSNLTEPMKEGGQGTTPSGSGARVRSTLVVAEIALAFVLLVGSGLLLRSLFGVLAVDPGFDATNVLTAGLPVPNRGIPIPRSSTGI